MVQDLEDVKKENALGGKPKTEVSFDLKRATVAKGSHFDCIKIFGTMETVKGYREPLRRLGLYPSEVALICLGAKQLNRSAHKESKADRMSPDVLAKVISLTERVEEMASSIKVVASDEYTNGWRDDSRCRFPLPKTAAVSTSDVAAFPEMSILATTRGVDVSDFFDKAKESVKPEIPDFGRLPQSRAEITGFPSLKKCLEELVVLCEAVKAQ